MSDSAFVIPYLAHNLHPAYSLQYDWSGWPTEGTTLPAGIIDAIWETAAFWAHDGLKLLHPHATTEKVQILFSVTPQISPALFCMRVKGRLQHALRKRGTTVNFSRKVGFRCLGENTSAIVEDYIRKQVGKAELADVRYARILDKVTVINHDVDLAKPSESNSGRYWYNLHLVLVVAERCRITNPAVLERIRDAAFVAAEEAGHRVAALAVMPDHTHMAVRGHIEQSPETVALLFQNRLAKAVGCRAWQDGFYVGTFSEYELDEIRKIAQLS